MLQLLFLPQLLKKNYDYLSIIIIIIAVCTYLHLMNKVHLMELNQF